MIPIFLYSTAKDNRLKYVLLKPGKMKQFLHLYLTHLLWGLLVCMSLHTASAQNALPSDDQTIILPIETKMVIRTLEPIGSDTHRTGNYFEGYLESPILQENKLIIPRGAWVRGIVVESSQAGNLKGRSRLALELTDVELGRWIYPVVTDQLGFVGKGADTGILTGAGAVIGAAISGWKGVFKGAALGLGVSALTPGKEIYLPKGSLLDFYLAEPLVLENDQI